MTQDALFVDKPRCPACGAAAKNACEHDADVERGDKGPLTSRPTGCVSSAQLEADEEMPF